MANIRAAERLYLDETKQIVVRQGDRRAAYLFRAQNQDITDAEVKKFSLDPATGIPLSAENKMATPGENKGDGSDIVKELLADHNHEELLLLAEEYSVDAEGKDDEQIASEILKAAAEAEK